MSVQRLFSFPNPVNEVSARLVAAGVVAQGVLLLALQERWLLVPLAYGFVARVLTGPKLSPLGQLVTRVVVPRLPIAPRPVAGPPKRFAQAMGTVFSVTALVLAFDGITAGAWLVVAMLVVAASLEAFAGFCIGCRVFAALMAVGLVPASVCAECSDISGRLAARSAPSAT